MYLLPDMIVKLLPAVGEDEGRFELWLTTTRSKAKIPDQVGGDDL